MFPSLENHTTISLQNEHSIISKGDNLPNFDPRKDSIALFLVALHEGMEPDEFQNKANWSDKLLGERSKFLVEKGWLTNDDRGLRPIVFIVSDLYNFEKMSFLV